MNDSQLSLKYEIYIAAPFGEVWEDLTDASATEHEVRSRKERQYLT